MEKIDKETQTKALKALERQTKQYKRQNNFIKENYDRLSVTFPRGTKERIQNTGETVNNYIKRVVLEALDKEK